MGDNYLERNQSELDLFIKMFDEGRFDWGEFYEGYYLFLHELSVHRDDYIGDGYVDVTNVFEVNGRFFRSEYWLGGKDLDEMFDVEVPVEVYPKKITTIEYYEKQ